MKDCGKESGLVLNMNSLLLEYSIISIQNENPSTVSQMDGPLTKNGACSSLLDNVCY